jgi:hypothetical protein
MQVISKSELLQTLKEIQCQMYRGRIDGVGAVSWFSDIVNEQTVIDAKEVVYGRWENITGGMITLGDCSECKVRQPVVGTNYCKNCGAKMDLED